MRHGAACRTHSDFANFAILKVTAKAFLDSRVTRCVDEIFGSTGCCRWQIARKNRNEDNDTFDTMKHNDTK